MKWLKLCKENLKFPCGFGGEQQIHLNSKISIYIQYTSKML